MKEPKRGFEFPKLRIIDLSDNSFTVSEGIFSSTLGNLIVLESLDLSNNKLSGQIPQQFGELTSLEFFDVSDNLVIGPIPQGKQFNTFETSSFDGNPGLCGEPLPKKIICCIRIWVEDCDWICKWAKVGLVLGHISSRRKYEWLKKTFRPQQKTNGRKSRCRQ
ncbi:hypothetical protein KPL70_003995 [Citrus sinensis]|nr:hypothetical protein KPL70_003995 [Citrus sinensis]